MPIALPPTGRGGLGWSDGAYRVSFHTITDFENTSYEAPSPQPRSPLPDGGRAMGEGTGVRFRGGGTRELQGWTYALPARKMYPQRTHKEGHAVKHPASAVRVLLSTLSLLAAGCVVNTALQAAKAEPAGSV